MKIKDLVEEVKEELEINNISKETIRTYGNGFNKFLEFIGEETEVEKIKESDIKNFHRFNKDRGLKQKTQNSYISALRSLFNYAVEEEIINKNPAMAVKLQKAKDKKTIEIFTKEEIIKLKNWKKSSRTFRDVRDNLIVCFLLETGCRNIEISYLREEDINPGFVLLKITKNSKPRVVPTSRTLEKMMRRYMRVKEEYFKKLGKYGKTEDYFILSKSGNRMWQQNIGQAVLRVCKDCGIPRHKSYPHNFRHTHAVMMLKNTSNVHLVSRLLGHCNLSITEEYLRGLTQDDIVEMTKGNSVLENL